LHITDTCTGYTASSNLADEMVQRSRDSILIGNRLVVRPRQPVSADVLVKLEFGNAGQARVRQSDRLLQGRMAWATIEAPKPVASSTRA
jgi:hypothetical protein